MVTMNRRYVRGKRENALSERALCTDLVPGGPCVCRHEIDILGMPLRDFAQDPCRTFSAPQGLGLEIGTKPVPCVNFMFEVGTGFNFPFAPPPVYGHNDYGPAWQEDPPPPPSLSLRRSVKTRRASPSRYCRVARGFGRTTTVMDDVSSPSSPTPPPTSCPRRQHKSLGCSLMWAPRTCYQGCREGWDSTWD